MGAILSAHPIRGDYQVVVTTRLLKSFCSATPHPKNVFMWPPSWIVKMLMIHVNPHYKSQEAF